MEKNQALLFATNLQILQDIKNKGLGPVLEDIWHNHWQLIVFLLIVTIGLRLIFGLAKTALYVIKARIIYYYAGILVLAMMPTITEFLQKQDIVKNLPELPTIGSFNVSTILATLLTLNLTRIITRQLSRRF